MQHERITVAVWRYDRTQALYDGRVALKDHDMELIDAPLEEIRETLGYGVVKMNIDTDTQYAFTRPIVGHMLKNYDGVLKIDGEVGDKKAYDPRSYLKKGEQGLCERMKEACDDLLSTGKTIYGTV